MCLVGRATGVDMNRVGRNNLSGMFFLGPWLPGHILDPSDRACSQLWICQKAHHCMCLRDIPMVFQSWLDSSCHGGKGTSWNVRCHQGNSSRQGSPHILHLHCVLYQLSRKFLASTWTRFHQCSSCLLGIRNELPAHLRQDIGNLLGKLDI